MVGRGSGLAAAVALAMLAGCALPGTREQEQSLSTIRAEAGVASAAISCGSLFIAQSALCAEVLLSGGTVLRFEGVGYRAIGTRSVRVWVAEAGGRVPHVISCHGAGPPQVSSVADFHRGGPFGQQLTPALLDVPDAIRRHQELAEQLQFWPECPQFWEGATEAGLRYRYCSHRPGVAPVTPPPPPACAVAQP